MRGLLRPGMPAKVVGSVLAAALLGMAVITAADAERQRLASADELARAAAHQADRLAASLEQPLYAFDDPTAADILGAELQAPDTRAIVVRAPGRPLLALERLEGGRVLEADGAPADPGLVRATRPVILDRAGRTLELGTVEVYLDPSAAHRRFVRNLLIGLGERSALLALVSSLAWWLLLRWAVRPLESLQRAFNSTRLQLGRAGAGRLPEVDPVERDPAAFREIREMGRSYRELVRAVNESATARSTLEERLRQTERMDALGQLAGGVAHDLNNLLTPIAAYAALLREGVAGDAELEEHASVVGDTARRASVLTRKLLAFSRKTTKSRRPLDLHQVVLESVALVRHAVDPRVEIVTALDARRHVVTGDPALVQNAILNLCVNARDAMPSGGTLRLETRLVEDGQERVELSVSDTGLGMPPEVQARVFEPFFTTKEVGRGTGLGLAAVQATMKEHGGAVSFTSRPGAGTTFRLLFPLEGQAPGAPDAPPAPAPAGDGGRVLVIEDEAVVRSAVIRSLGSAGWRADEAATGPEGVERFRAAGPGAYRAVLLDMVLPGADGREVLEAIRAVDAAVPVLLTSGSGRDAFPDALARPRTAFLPKPFAPADVARALHDLLAAAGVAPVRPGAGG